MRNPIRVKAFVSVTFLAVTLAISTTALSAEQSCREPALKRTLKLLKNDLKHAEILWNSSVQTEKQMNANLEELEKITDKTTATSAGIFAAALVIGYPVLGPLGAVTVPILSYSSVKLMAELNVLGLNLAKASRNSNDYPIAPDFVRESADGVTFKTHEIKDPALIEKAVKNMLSKIKSARKELAEHSLKLQKSYKLNVHAWDPLSHSARTYATYNADVLIEQGFITRFNQDFDQYAIQFIEERCRLNGKLRSTISSAASARAIKKLAESSNLTRSTTKNKLTAKTAL
jgi:hypothetical protein